MFLLLIRALLWLATGGLIYWLLFKFIPKGFFTLLGGAVIAGVLAVSFYEPNNTIPEFVWQFIIFPFKPLNIALLLLGWSAFSIVRSSDDKVLKSCLSSAFICLFLLSIPAISQPLVKIYESGALSAKSSEPTAASNVIVLLGQDTTSVHLTDGPAIQLTDLGDRLLYTAQLYREQAARSPRVLISAGPRENLRNKKDEDKPLPEITAIKEFLNSQGVPSSAFLEDPNSPTIRLSAENVKKLLKEKGYEGQKVILVTSAINMRRAKLTFRALGIGVIARASDFYSLADDNDNIKRELTIHDALPSVDSLFVMTKVIEDLFGSIYYFLRGWATPNWGFFFGDCQELCGDK